MRSKSVPPVVWAALAVPVLWTAVLAAGVYESGMNLFQLLERLSAAAHLFSVRWTAYTPRFVLVFLMLYGGVVVLYYSGRENRRPGEEYGSARWGSARQLNGKYADKDPANNTLLTRHVAMSLNGRQHGRNLLQIIVGGSGAGKTRYFCKPNIMQVNGSFLVTDPNGKEVLGYAWGVRLAGGTDLIGGIYRMKKSMVRRVGRVFLLSLCVGTLTAATAYAAGDDPLAIVNNLSDFIFSIIKAVGIIILGWGVVQVGMSIQSHDASQRTQGLLCLFGGLLIAFAKEILTLIGAV